jgi:hypothetical protein
MLDDYFRALQTADWEALAAAVAPDVRRVGPFADVVEGREAYVGFLSGLLPTLPAYALTVTAVHALPGGGAFVELTEAFDVEGQRREFPEAIRFGFDDDGRVSEVVIYTQRPGAQAPVAGGRAGS